MSDIPDDLVQAQADLLAARAAYITYRHTLSGWAEPMPERTLRDGAVMPAEPGWTDEQRAEERRLLEGERQAAAAVLYHPWWSEVEKGQVVKTRERLLAAATALEGGE